MNGPEYVAGFPQLKRLAEACAQDPRVRERFATEEACRRWFFRARWPNGFECPICRGTGRRIPSRGVIECRKCRKQTSLTSGTLLHGTRKPLKTWFEAAYLIVQHGVNARTLQRELGLTYKVAWAWGHKLRAALRQHVVPENAAPEEQLKLSASRTPWDWVQLPTPARKEPCGCSRLLRRDWAFPNELEEDKLATKLDREDPRGTRREERTIPADSPPSSDLYAATNLLATYKGSVSEKHLKRYLDEYAFRQNRTERPIAQGFATLVRAIASTGPITYRAIAARPPATGHGLSIFAISAPVRRASPVAQKFSLNSRHPL